jgi:hypothetical protein
MAAYYRGASVFFSLHNAGTTAEPSISFVGCYRSKNPVSGDLTRVRNGFLILLSLRNETVIAFNLSQTEAAPAAQSNGESH